MRLLRLLLSIGTGIGWLCWTRDDLFIPKEFIDGLRFLLEHKRKNSCEDTSTVQSLIEVYRIGGLYDLRREGLGVQMWEEKTRQGRECKVREGIGERSGGKGNT